MGTMPAMTAHRFPVIVYVAGWGNGPTDNTALAEDLASHGMVVAAFGDVNRDVPPSRLAGAANFSSHGAYQATLQLGNEKLPYQARRASAVLDYLAALDATDPAGRFTGRLNTKRVGILGYSFGGAVALETCRTDPRFRAALNMDGWIFDAASGYRGGAAYFLVSSGSATPSPQDVTAADPVRRYTSQFTVIDEERQMAVLRRGGYALNIDGADHLNFTDVPLYAPLHRMSRGRYDPRRLASVIRTYAVAFFEQELDGRPSPLLAPGYSHHPSLTLVHWPRRAPLRDGWKPHDATY